MKKHSLGRWTTSLLAALACCAAAQVGPGSYGGTVSGLDLMDVDLMFIGAHPDDDGGVTATLARYVLDGGHKATVITLTGGEGGGNATGTETGRALGLIREEEERRSLSMVGVTSPHFLGLRDFYFTLSAEETEKMWGGQAFVCDVVRIVRVRRPEVILTMWPGPGTHGQHQMATRAATLAYNYAGDAKYCPEQLKEGIVPFTPLKLYYYPGSAADATVRIPTDDISRTARIRYADLKSVAQFNYRSQGWDATNTLPARAANPESFMLVGARVPVAEQETSLLTGAVTAGTSPVGVRLEIRPDSYEIGLGRAAPVRVTLTNQTGMPMTATRLRLNAPEGWQVTGGSASRTLAPGETHTAVFNVTAPAGAKAENMRLTASYTATQEDRGISGRNAAFVRPLPAVVATFAPTFDVAGYQAFARETGTEWVTGSLATRLPLVVGQSTEVTVNVTNRGTSAASGQLELKLPPGVTLVGSPQYQVGAGATTQVRVQLQATAAALPAGRQSALLPISLSTAGFTDQANAYVLPSLTIPRLGTAPKIDGDLSDMAAGAGGALGPEDLWWRTKPDSPADASASFKMGYDDQYLYVGLNVKDELVACNIAPNDVKAQLRSDAIGITVDPTGQSRDTSTTLQAAAFPCTTAGFQARGFRDADANQGVMEETAPGMQVASVKVDGGYAIEFRLPWAAMPTQPKAGATVGLNLVMYDGDQEGARVGANISQSGLAWSAFSWGGKQALPYLWPRVTLGN
ncbi:LmbE family N-acetylglucosaminyl deacetylase [Deinococcus budaensis]|uniref:LmbE family N-acetylglucosaminyl deacetylase n=1 Tax=Deinococcus budaensis TaxID=1665626 RepID=A0A7W8LQF0_9DEIO|nr:PIG-L family deacetylase [Deinococcus budaensis]MBB5234664.1 LmbE family N-acetylglucosaminyl deacetylase [Deinococcus budaensis]